MKLKLTADREKILANRNDLSYVTVEVVDANDRRVPNAAIPVRFSVTGAGELAARGNGSPNHPASFRAPLCQTFEGRCLAILRPKGSPGKIMLRADAEGLKSSQTAVITR
jgi:beta-galactosidase